MIELDLNLLKHDAVLGGDYFYDEDKGIGEFKFTYTSVHAYSKIKNYLKQLNIYMKSSRGYKSHAIVSIGENVYSFYLEPTAKYDIISGQKISTFETELSTSYATLFVSPNVRIKNLRQIYSKLCTTSVNAGILRDLQWGKRNCPATKTLGIYSNNLRQLLGEEERNHLFRFIKRYYDYCISKDEYPMTWNFKLMVWEV